MQQFIVTALLCLLTSVSYGQSWDKFSTEAPLLSITTPVQKTKDFQESLLIYFDDFNAASYLYQSDKDLPLALTYIQKGYGQRYSSFLFLQKRSYYSSKNG